MASVFEILSQNNSDPIQALINSEKAKVGQSTYVPYTEDFQFGTSESSTQTIYNPRKLELEAEKKNIVAEANAAIATAQAATEQKRKDILAVKNIEADGKFVNYTGPEVSKTLSSDTSDIPAEYVIKGEAEDGGDLYLKSNGKSYAEVLKEYKAANGEEVSGAFFTKNAEDIIGNDRVSNEQREYLDSGEALLPDGSYEQTEGRDFHAHLGEKAEIEAKAKAQQKRFEDILDRHDEELHGGEAQAKRLYDEMNLKAYKKQKEEEKLAVGRKRRADFHENRRLDKIAEESDKAAELQAEKDASAALVAESLALTEENLKQSGIKQSALQREKDVEKRIKDIEWEEYKKRSQKRTRENFEDALNTSTAPDTMATDLASIKDAEGKKIAYPDDIHGIGTSITEQTSNAEELAAEKAKKEREAQGEEIQRSLDDEQSTNERIAKEKADAFRKKMDDAHKSYRPRTGPVEKSKTREKYATHGDKLGTPDLLTGKDPFRFSTLAYPMNITTDPEYGHYMLFYVNVQNKTGYKYAGYNDDDQLALIGDIVETQSYSTEYGEASGATGSDATTSTVPKNHQYQTYYHVNEGANNDEVAYQRQAFLQGKRGNYLQSNQVTLMRQRKATTGLAARVNTTTRITDSVAMYLPADVASNVSASYQGSDMGLLGFLALGGADVINQIKNRDFEGAADNFLGMGERALSEMIKKAGIAAVETGFGTSGTTEVFNKIFGQTTNPFLEVAFQNLGLRQFDYTFNFRPRSDVETDEVKAIIQLFRFHMAPELKGTNHRYMTLPSTFDIHYMYQSDPETAKENSFYNKIATCVLERCDVNYTPTGVKSFDDGAPTEITMSLSFKETELLTKQKINDGF